jgi:salicylate hydroxylase
MGAGVGGLSSAIALKLAGHYVIVYEQAAALSEVGKHLSLVVHPNSLQSQY